MKQHGFSKQERICKRNDFHTLLTKGKSIYVYPFRCVYLWQDTPMFSAKIAISVSRRRFKHAVDRNRIKRLVRENYRLNKNILYQNFIDENRSLNMLVIYTDTKLLSFSFLQKKTVELMKKIIKENGKDAPM